MSREFSVVAIIAAFNEADVIGQVVKHLVDEGVGVYLLDHGSTESTLSHPGGSIHLQGSKEYTHWVVWTHAGRDFVCLEPWTCPGDALNSNDRLIRLAPSETRELWLSMSFSR